MTNKISPSNRDKSPSTNKTSGASPATNAADISQRTKSPTTATLPITKAAPPTTKLKLAILLPRTLPKEITGKPSIAAATATKNSGNDVNKATKIVATIHLSQAAFTINLLKLSITTLAANTKTRHKPIKPSIFIPHIPSLNHNSFLVIAILDRE